MSSGAFRSCMPLTFSQLININLDAFDFAAVQPDAVLVAAVDDNSAALGEWNLLHRLVAFWAFDISGGSHHRAVIARPTFNDRLLVRFGKLVDFGAEDFLERDRIDPVAPARIAKRNVLAFVHLFDHGQLAAWAVRHFRFRKTWQEDKQISSSATWQIQRGE